MKLTDTKSDCVRDVILKEIELELYDTPATLPTCVWREFSTGVRYWDESTTLIFLVMSTDTDWLCVRLRLKLIRSKVL